MANLKWKDKTAVMIAFTNISSQTKLSLSVYVTSCDNDAASSLSTTDNSMSRGCKHTLMTRSITFVIIQKKAHCSLNMPALDG